MRVRNTTAGAIPPFFHLRASGMNPFIFNGLYLTP